MTQPPQDRPDYPWGPSETDRGATGAAAAGEPTSRTGGSTRMGASGPSTAPSAPYSDTPYSGTPYSGTPYTGTPATSAAEAPGAYAGTAAATRQQGTATPVSTIVLLVLSGLAVLTGAFTLAGLPALVLSIVALTRSGSDPAGARRLTNLGWWIFAGLIVLGIVLIVVGFALLAAFGSNFITDYQGTDPFDTSLAPLTSLLGLAAR